MAQTLYINRAWADGKPTDTNYPFPEDIVINFGTYGFADSHFVTPPTTDTVWFAACNANNVYSELDLTREVGTVVTLFMRPCTYGDNTYDTAYIYRLDNDDALEISSDSKFTFGSVKNESGETITISGAGTVFKVASGIIGSSGTSNGEFFNDGTLTVENGAYFEADTIENDVGGGHTVSVTGLNTKFIVDREFDNNGKLTVGTGAYFESKSFTNNGTRVVEISGSNTFFKVIESFTDNGTFSVTGGAKFEAGSFTNGGGETLTVSGSGTEFKGNRPV